LLWQAGIGILPTVTNAAQPHGRMKRLPKPFYTGLAFVHWAMTIQDRSTGWLDDAFHREFREIQLHTLSRYCLLCLAYTLIPDHIHLLWAGLSEQSDQDNAAAFLRQFLNRELKGRGLEFQKQPWDTVLRERDRERGAVVKTAFYIVENPVRAGLTSQAREWPFSGAQAAGYPDLDWRLADFATRLWAIHDTEVRRLRAV
jgi:REP element-mobilizing transposase RayT